MSTTFNLSNEALEAVLFKSIIDGFSTEAKEKLLKDAVTHLLTKPPNNTNIYGEKTSPFQSAFNRAVETVAQKVANEYIQNNEEFKNQIHTLFVDASKKLFEDGENRERIIDAIGVAIRQGLTKDRY